MGDTQKQRLTAFVDPVLIKRAKVRGALEGLTISEVVEKALDEYAPLIIADDGSHINLIFDKGHIPIELIPKIKQLEAKQVAKHTKSLNVPGR